MGARPSAARRRGQAARLKGADEGWCRGPMLGPGLLLLAEALAELLARVAQGLFEVRGLDVLGDLLPARLAHLAQVPLEYERAPEHDQEAGEAEDEVVGEGGDEDGETGEEAQTGPREVPPRMP